MFSGKEFKGKPFQRKKSKLFSVENTLDFGSEKFNTNKITDHFSNVSTFPSSVPVATGFRKSFAKESHFFKLIKRLCFVQN